MMNQLAKNLLASNPMLSNLGPQKGLENWGNLILPSAIGNMYIDSGGNTTTRPLIPDSPSSQELYAAQQVIAELTEVLERIKQEALILYRIDRISKDGKHAYVNKGETELRIQASVDLKEGDEVLLHPKTMQIVERLGKPPLEMSKFAPDTVPNVAWSDIGGLEAAKADMIEAIEMPHKNKKLFKFYKKKQVKGILLSGPPGCGKTMLGKAAATSLATLYGADKARTGFLYVKGPEILNQFVGQTEQNIRDIFYDAKRHKEEHGYPAIVFIDEADAILATRGRQNMSTLGNTIVPQFLTEMDGLEESGAIVIIATNRPDVLDPAIVRDGRIDRKVEVSRPLLEDAVTILKLNLKDVPISDEKNYEFIAQETGSLVYKDPKLNKIVSGAMLANCVQLAISSAIQRDLKSKEQSGIGLDDIKYAVERLSKQSTIVQHDLGHGPQVMAVALISGQGGDPDSESSLPGERKVH